MYKYNLFEKNTNMVLIEHDHFQDYVSNNFTFELKRKLVTESLDSE